MPNHGQKILLIVAGGIACYKSLEIVRQLTDKGHSVSVAMTPAACEFVRPLSFETLSGNPVRVGLFDGKEGEISHIQLAQENDCIIVAPATAGIIGKLANGQTDDLASAILLAAKAPVLMAPAMNTQMWENPAVRRNIQTLKEDGINFVGPGSGFLACKTIGPGRMAEPAEIVRSAEMILSGRPSLLSGKKIMVTAGPTIEPIDKFRFISNYSSGKMGYAIAAAAASLGAETKLVSGPVHIQAPSNINSIAHVSSAEEMRRAVIEDAPLQDAIIMAAAVSDFAPSYFDGKIKKGGDAPSALNISLQKTADILAELGRNKKNGQFLVGFCAETENLEKEAERKLKDKNLDMVVANMIGQEGTGFGSDSNTILLLSKAGRKTLSSSKEELGFQIIEELARLMS